MKYLLVLLCACFFLSCGGDKVPSGILPPQQMETIIWQLMQTDEFVVNTFVRDSTKNLTTERIRRYRQVFQLNNTSKETFQKSYEYYMAHPGVTKTMLDSLSARATRRADTLLKPPVHPGMNKLITKPSPAK